VEIGSEKSKNKRKIGQSSGSRWLLRRRAADCIRRAGRRECWAGWAGSVRSAQIFFFFFFCFLISFITFVFYL
jgi:hypothetical protein